MATVALGSREGKWIIVSAILASSMAFIDSTALNVVLPSLQKSLGATGADLFWILNAYLLMLAALILTGGALGDKLGRKKIFMMGILVFMGGSCVCGFAPDTRLLIICRIIQGAGGALMIPGSLSLLSASIDENERGKAIGTWSAFTTVVTIGGPVLGGALADAGLWRYIFFINIPIGLVALFILGWKIDSANGAAEGRDGAREAGGGQPEGGNSAAGSGGGGGVDVPGVCTIVLGLASLTFGFLRWPSLGFANWEVAGTIGAGVCLLAAFILIEKKSDAPMMPLFLFADRNFSGANLLTFFLYAGLGAGMLFLSLNLVQVQGYDQLQSGLTFLPFTVLMITIARFAGALADKHGPRLLLLVGPAVAGTGLLLLSFVGQTRGPGDYWTTFFPGIFTLGLGMSFTVAPLTTTVMTSVKDQFSGTASGVNNAMTRISGVFANAILGALAVLFFSGALQDRVQGIPMNAADRQAVMAEAVNLGNAKAPARMGNDEKEKIGRAYRAGFIDSYAGIMRIAAGLAFLGALMSVVLIRNPRGKSAASMPGT